MTRWRKNLSATTLHVCAIAAAYKMDEVKDIRDKVLALATADYSEPKKSDGQQ